MSNYQKTVPELDGDESTHHQQERPDVLRGEVYFNFHDDQYRLLHNNERIDPRSVIYHEGRDQCHHFSRNQTWKSAPLVDFPDDAAYYLYRSGPLQTPDWLQMSHSLMSPLPSVSSHVSFQPSTFKPVRPPGNPPLDVPITHPTPIQPHYNTEQQIPFSTFWNPFTFETPQQHPPLQDIRSNNYIQPVSNMQQTLSTNPFLNTLLAAYFTITCTG